MKRFVKLKKVLEHRNMYNKYISAAFYTTVFCPIDLFNLIIVVIELYLSFFVKNTDSWFKFNRTYCNKMNSYTIYNIQKNNSVYYFVYISI